jgi:hypothetical protein
MRFSTSFFSSNNSIWAPDPQVKAFLDMAPYSRRYSTLKLIFCGQHVSMIPLTRVADLYPHSKKSGAGSDLNLALSHSIALPTSYEQCQLRRRP